MSELMIETGSIQDVPPDYPEDNEPITPPTPAPVTEWYNKDFPHSTPEVPYGYFPNPDGSPDFSRPRTRKPRGYTGDAKPSPGKPASGSNSRVSRTTAASDAQAKQAASLLGTMNGLVGMSLAIFGMPVTAEALKDANEDFEEQAYLALLNDPALCRKILSAGASSGKAQLTMAYVALGASVGPAAWLEIQTRRAE